MSAPNFLSRVVSRLATAALAASIPIVATAQATVRGTSANLDFERLVPSNAGAETLRVLGNALEGYEAARSESLQRVREARQAYDLNPCPETVAGLFKANADVIRAQYDALDRVMQAAQEAATELEELRVNVLTAKNSFTEHVTSAARARTRALHNVEKIDGQLQELAERYEEIVGPDGQIADESVEGAVILLAAGRDHEEIVGQLAAGDFEAAQTDLKDLDELADHLRRQRDRLRLFEARAKAQRATLASVAESEIRRKERWDLLQGGLGCLKRANGLNAPGLLEGRPVLVMPTSGGSVLTDYGVPEASGRRGADILLEMRNRPNERRRSRSEENPR